MTLAALRGRAAVAVDADGASAAAVPPMAAAVSNPRRVAVVFVGQVVGI
jgi:hypothetical protein